MNVSLYLPGVLTYTHIKMKEQAKPALPVATSESPEVDAPPTNDK